MLNLLLIIFLTALRGFILGKFPKEMLVFMALSALKMDMLLVNTFKPNFIPVNQLNGFWEGTWNIYIDTDYSVGKVVAISCTLKIFYVFSYLVSNAFKDWRSPIVHR